jgi:uncharacterized protein YuzB (UPF0349 family)
MVVEYCLSNVDRVPDGEGSAELDLTGRPCLEHCGTCRREPFVVVDGTLRRGVSLAGLVAESREGSE